jgi:4-amino-4-deoxy-L-arabinose transferase-like glycosyltransferase
MMKPASSGGREHKIQTLRDHIPHYAWLALLTVFAAVYVGSAFSPAVLDDADATHAEAAREMALSGDFVTLRVNSIRYLEKAPLMYWLTAFSYRALGVSEFSTRLPLLVGVLLHMVLAFVWGQRAFGRRAGTYAGFFLLTTAGFYLFTRILIPEVLLSLFLGSSLYFFLTGLDRNAKEWRWYAGYACLALAVLTKGLVALVFVGGAAAAYLLISGEWVRWREFRLLPGLALFLAISAPWHLTAGLRNRGFFWFYFVNEHFLRFLGCRYPKDYNKLPAAAYWGLQLVWLFPWSLHLPAAARELWLARSRRPADFASRTRLLCAIYAALVLLFFSVSTNQEYYTFPAYLPLVLLVAGALSAEEKDVATRCVLVAHCGFVMIGMTVAAALLAGLWSSRHLPIVSDIGTVMAERGVGGNTLSMSHFADLTTASFAALRLPAALAAFALLSGPLAGLVLCLRKRAEAAIWTVAATAALFLVAAHIALVRFEPYLSSVSLAKEIARQISPSDQLMIYGDQALGSSLLLYLQRPIYLVNGRSTSMWFGSNFPDAPPIFLDDNGLRSAWQSPQRIFLFVAAANQTQARAALPPPVHVVAQSSGKVIYSNR